MFWIHASGPLTMEVIDTYETLKAWRWCQCSSTHLERVRDYYIADDGTILFRSDSPRGREILEGGI